MSTPYSFGRASTAQLVTCHTDLQIVLTHAIEVVDFSITQGARTIAEQVRNIRSRVSKTLDSYHIPRDADGHYDPNAPALAADCVPYEKGVNPWPQASDSSTVRGLKRGRFYYGQGVFLAIAHRENIALQAGIDWDGDGSFFDQSFHDLPHIGLRRDRAPLIVPADLLVMANEALRAVGLREYRNP